MPASPPNILWIVTTQWRGQAAGYAGDSNARTPHLDALAVSSVNYAQAVTPHPFGPFARAAMLTGRPSPENGVCDYYDPLPAQTRTIAHRLREGGYSTAFFGKWHLYQRDPEAELVGAAHAKIVVPPAWRGGFEFWEGFESGFLINDPWLHGTKLAAPTKFPGYQPAVLADRINQWWSGTRKDRRPWFCVVSMEPPHPPYDARPDQVKPRRPEDVALPANVPAGGAVEAKARRELAGYYAHLEATDACIGRLVTDLQRREPTGNTYIVLTSVHGDMHGAHGLFRKGWPYEESVRVPLLVRRPFGAGDGALSHDPISLIDLPEMALAWAESRTWTCKRDHAQISMPCVVHLPDQCDRVWRGVRTRTRKLVLTDDGAPWLFFDLERDAREEHDLSGDSNRAAEIAALRRWI